MELEKNEGRNKLKLQKKINKLLEIEIKQLQNKIEISNEKKNDSNRLIRIEDESDNNVNILEDLDKKSEDSADIKIVKQKIPKEYIASYNDKRNAIKKEKSKLFKSFQSQDKLEVNKSTPKNSPKVNNYIDLNRRKTFMKESQFKRQRDRNKSASVLVKSMSKKALENPELLSNRQIDNNFDSNNIKQPENNPVIEDTKPSNVEKPSNIVSINVSNTNNTNAFRVYDKIMIDTGNQKNFENFCANFHFQHNLDKNNNMMAVFEIKEEYLLNLASNKPDIKNSFMPSFDSKFSVDMDYSHSLIQPRISSIAKAPTIVDSNIKRSSCF